MDGGFLRKSILIGGLGLIGGSFAKALAGHGYEHLYAYDRDEQTLADAKKDGVIREGYTTFCEDMPEFDLVLCCLSPAHVTELYQNAAPHMREGSVFAEIGGIKTSITTSLAEMMHPSHQLLSLHPMAGSEKSGYAHADAQLFSGSVLIAVPGAKTGHTAYGWIKIFELTMGFKHTRTLSAEEHDRVIAHVSHIPHVAALAIQSMYPDSGNDQFAGGSYGAVTRVADINAPLWAELLTDNKAYLLESIAELKKQLGALEDAIAAGDAQSLQSLLEKIAQGRKQGV